MGKLYLLNSPILTSWGIWRYRKVDEKEVRALLEQDWISAIGHPATAEFLSKKFGEYIPCSRLQIQMKAGDRALVFRVKQRLPEGKVLTEEELAKVPIEVGLLEYIKAEV